MLVEHASTVENAGVAWSSPASISTSRAMLLQPRLGATVPHTMRSGRGRRRRAARPSPWPRAPTAPPHRGGAAPRRRARRVRHSGPATSRHGVRVSLSIRRLRARARSVSRSRANCCSSSSRPALAMLMQAAPRPGRSGSDRVHARDIVPAERVGHLARAVAVHAERLERRAPDAQRRLEGLALDHLDAAQLELEVVRHVARARDDRQVGEVRAHAVDEREAVARRRRSRSPAGAPCRRRPPRSRSSRVASP